MYPLGLAFGGTDHFLRVHIFLGSLNALLSTGKTLYFKCHCGQF